MVPDHGTMNAMEEIAISKFKATCLAVLEEVHKTGKPVLVTRFGKPVAEIVPPSAPEKSRGWIGSFAGTARIVGDIIGPATDPGDWEVLRS
jgi:prevent-host-death family protein